MSFGASYDTKERVKQAVDIVDLVGSYVQLRRDGRSFKALCPWHDDSRPSLQINQERQSFKCWVCDIGGDIFSFVMKIEGVTFPEALQMLADRAGIPLPAPEHRRIDNQSSGPPAGAEDKRLLYRAMSWAVDEYHKFLLGEGPAEIGRKYFADRGIGPGSVQKFQLGYVPDQWDWLLERAKGTPFTPPVLERVGLVKRRSSGSGYYDSFRGRVLFPIFDVQNRAVALGGRILPEFASDETPKYYNSPETPLFSKSKLLYGLNIARKAIATGKTALVMEGYTDCVVAHQCGFEHAVAVLGTALGAKQISLLSSFAERIRMILVLDGDDAGRKRAGEILELFVAENVNLRVLTLPDELDPCEFLLERGHEAFAEVVESSVDALKHAFLTATTGLDLRQDVQESSQALEQLLSIIAKAPRLRADTTTEDRLREEKFLQRLAFDFQVPEADVRQRMTQLRRKTAPRAGKDAITPASPAPTAKTLAPLEREFLELLLKSPEILPQARLALAPQELEYDLGRRIYAKCLELSALGLATDFDRLLLEFDDAWVKNLLVQLDEHGRLKGPTDPQITLNDVLAGFQRRREEPQRRAQAAALKERRLEEDQELAILLEMQQQERNRQGISGPTDG